MTSEAETIGAMREKYDQDIARVSPAVIASCAELSKIVLEFKAAAKVWNLTHSEKMDPDFMPDSADEFYKTLEYMCQVMAE